MLRYVVPILDLLRGVDDVNPTKEQEKVMDKMWKYRIPTLAWVPAQYITLIFCTWIATHQNLTCKPASCTKFPPT